MMDHKELLPNYGGQTRSSQLTRLDISINKAAIDALEWARCNTRDDQA